MNDSCLSYNKYLRQLPSQENHYPTSMTWVLLSVQALESALQAIQMYEKRMKAGKDAIECHTTIKLSVEGTEKNHMLKQVQLQDVA